MLDQKDVQTKSLIVQRELQAKLGVQGRDLGHALRRAGRRLPAPVRKQGAALARAEFFARNPKMARRLDKQAVQKAYDTVIGHLGAIDAGSARKDRWVRVGSSVAFDLLFVAAAFIFYLWWRGYV